MYRVLLTAAVAAIISISTAKAESQSHGSTGIAGLELGTRLTNRADVKAPQSDPAKPSSAEKGVSSEDEAAKRTPIRKVRVIY